MPWPHVNMHLPPCKNKRTKARSHSMILMKSD